jgi:uncharacterized lipoprotein YddW (UPF0748 family)
MRKILYCIALCALLFAGCQAPPSGKEKLIWLDANGNFQRFGTQEGITCYLDKIKECGFNKIVVDVRPVTGYALYKSDILPPLTKLGDVTINRDWDYLQFFIDQARHRGMKVAVSVTVFTAGSPVRKQGIVYDNPAAWAGKTCLQYTKDGAMLDIKDDPSKVSAFLNPVLPEVRAYCMNFIKEVVAKYDFDALVLDYCRFEGEESDFSPTTRAAFESYIGVPLNQWPGDVFTWKDSTRQAGPYYKKWWEFRAKLIADFVKDVSTEIKAIKPHIMLEYWAASWVHALYPKGQNWASKNYDFSKKYSEWASPEYKQAGFAEYLDVFQLGAYLYDIYGLDNNESVEYAIASAKEKIGGACRIYGTIFALNHINNVEDAVYVSLSQTDGLMVFDISQVVQFDEWDAIKKGINRAEAE